MNVFCIYVFLVISNIHKYTYSLVSVQTSFVLSKRVCDIICDY